MAASVETVPLFEAPVLAIAVVVSPTPTGISAFAVGLTTEGPVDLVRVRRPGVAYGPFDTRADLDLAVMAAASEPDPLAAARQVGAAVGKAAAAHPGFVSTDWDAVHVTVNGSRLLARHRHEGPRVPYGA
jgi:hypothetical protein